MAKKNDQRCPSCGARIEPAGKSCPSCGAEQGIAQLSEADERSTGQPKLEWQISQGCFRIDKRGASYTAPTKNPLITHSEEIGSLMTAYGVIKGSPGITSVGLATTSRSNSKEKGWTVRWKDVREIKFNPEEHVVSLKEKWFTGGLGGGLGTRRLYCTPENYETVAATCQTFHSRALQHVCQRAKASSKKLQAAPKLPPPPPPTYSCPTCGEPLTYIPQYNRWYCYRDQKYA